MKISRLLTILFVLVSVNFAFAQSFELMAGTKRVFFDVKIIKIFDGHENWSLLNRSRATAEYDEYNTDLFTGTYLNYSTNAGFGGTLVGNISSTNSGFDVGVHYFKATSKFFAYILPAIRIKDELLLTGISFLRYSPDLKNDWKLFLSLEVFTAFNKNGHLKSGQRARAGFSKKGYSFGLAVNILEKGTPGDEVDEVDVNPGVFVGKSF